MTVDKTVPGAKWEFNAEVADAFDDMLKRSIPQYEQMRKLTFDIGCRFVRSKTAVVDLGCSRGEALAPFIDRFGATIRSIGIECSEPMLAAAKARYRSCIEAGIVEIKNGDLRSYFPPVRSSLVLSILTLQFVPINYRQVILSRAFESLESGGAMMLVEKVLGDGANVDGLLVDCYHSEKIDRGYSAEDVARKAAALEGVLVPVTAAWNEQLLRRAGFEQVDCFWRWLNFAGWLAIKR